MTLNLRNAPPETLMEQLHKLHDAKLDIVVSASDLTATGREMTINYGEPELTNTGVIPGQIHAKMSNRFIGSLADRIGLPVKYARWMLDAAVDTVNGPSPELLDLFDTNVNRLLDRKNDNQRYLVRLYRGQGPNDTDVARALLGSKYQFLDYLPTIEAAFGAMQNSGLEMQLDRCDLTDNRMYVKVLCPSVAQAAPELLDGYVSPFNGRKGADNPLVTAGFKLSTSETGQGSLQCQPFVEVEVCSNGLVIEKAGMRKTHIGGQLDSGEVSWSDDTMKASADLVHAQVADIITHTMTPAWLGQTVDELTAQSQTPINGAEEEKAVIARIGGQLKWSQDERENIMRQFIKGGQPTSGGIAQAVTAYAQEVDNADRAHELEAMAVKAMALA